MLSISSDAENTWEAAFGEQLRRRIDTAAWLALKDLETLVSIQGRAAIKAGGFGSNWQNAWRTKVYPSDRPSLDAALYAYHKIPYAGIFETGGAVSGKPLIWIPTRNVPTLPGRQRKMPPARYVRSIGPLSGPRRSTGSNRKPILFGNLRGTKKRVPMFIGLRTIFQRKRFDVGKAVANAARMFPQFYERRLSQSNERPE